MQFSIGEWVKRRMDGKIGQVVKAEAYDGDFVFYVDLDAEGRRGAPADTDLWAGTTPAWERASNLHAHEDRQSQDCDGRYTSGQVYEMTLEERCDPYGFGDLHFKQRVVSNAISVHALRGKLDIDEDGFEWEERTEEGYRAVQIRWCEDTCSDRSWQRDHSAEAAGY